MNEAHYYRIDLEYIQRSSLLIAAETPEQANELVIESVDPAVRGFTILSTIEVSEEEKDRILHSVTEEERTIN